MPCQHRTRRRGVVAVKTALLLIPMMGLLALAIDYGYLLKFRTDLQRAADMAALAAVRDLARAGPNGNQDVSTVRATVRQYADANIEEVTNFQVLDSDIQIGRYDPSTIYSNITLLNDGDFDTVRIRVRRDATANSPVSLFFARALGRRSSGVSAISTAILQKASRLRPGDGVLPFTVPEYVWDAQDVGDSWRNYRNGGLEDIDGNSIPGNWGTIDIGSENNSTADISDQIDVGLRQSDLDELYDDERISTNRFIDTSAPLQLQGETGLSTGIRDSVLAAEGRICYIPIFDTVTGSGNSSEFNIVKWGAVRVRNSNWQGNANTWIRLEKTYSYDLDLRPHANLSDNSGTIDGAFTAAALVE